MCLVGVVEALTAHVAGGIKGLEASSHSSVVEGHVVESACADGARDCGAFHRLFLSK